MNRNPPVLVLTVLLLLTIYASGNIRLPLVIASNIVLQQQSKVAQAVLFFDNAPGGFITKGNKKATEFYIAGEDKNFLPADVNPEKDRIIVFHKQIKNPVAVRFAFSNTAMSNLFGKEGLPVCPFRTDNWEVDTSKEIE